MIKITQASGNSVEFRHEDFKLSMHRKTPALEWVAELHIASGPKEIQQLRLDLAEELERVADILRSQEASIIKIVTEAL